MTCSTTTEGKTAPQARPHRKLVWRFLRLMCLPFFVLWVPLRLTGIKNLDNTRGGLLLLNHQSYLDPLVAGIRLQRPVCYLARDGLFDVPLIGWILRNTYTLAISQSAFRASSIREAVERMEQGFLVGVFPEGSRSSGEVKKFHRGFLALVRRVNFPVYPVGIAGTDRVFSRGSFFIRPGRVAVAYGPPLTPEEQDHLRNSRNDAELTEMMRQRVTECVHTAAESLR